MANAAASLLLYALPVALMWGCFYWTGQRPWTANLAHTSNLAQNALDHMSKYGLLIFVLCLGAVEFALGLYEDHWTRNESMLDIACFAVSHLVVKPVTIYFSLLALPWLLPAMKNIFAWVPFWWGFFIIAVADDLTQYWYHRLHHQVPWLWRFHRTHHSAPYMGMAMTSRQNFLYTVFFSQTYLTATLVYFGLGASSVAVLVLKSLIVNLAHSSITWDKPFYRYPVLHPIAWVLERLISTPATHHAHHAASTDDGIGYYKGNFGNMFFLWDVIFGTAFISRQYPRRYGISHYESDEWYAQLLWPILKSKVQGSELAAGGPVVREDVREDVPRVELVEVVAQGR